MKRSNFLAVIAATSTALAIPAVPIMAKPVVIQHPASALGHALKDIADVHQLDMDSLNVYVEGSNHEYSHDELLGMYSKGDYLICGEDTMGDDTRGHHYSRFRQATRISPSTYAGFFRSTPHKVREILTGYVYPLEMRNDKPLQTYFEVHDQLSRYYPVTYKAPWRTSNFVPRKFAQVFVWPDGSFAITSEIALANKLINKWLEIRATTRQKLDETFYPGGKAMYPFTEGDRIRTIILA